MQRASWLDVAPVIAEVSEGCPIQVEEYRQQTLSPVSPLLQKQCNQRLTVLLWDARILYVQRIFQTHRDEATTAETQD